MAIALACAMVWLSMYFLGQLGVKAPEVGNFDREMRIIANSAKQLVNESRTPQDMKVALKGLGVYIEWNSQVHGTPNGFMSFRAVATNGELLARGGVGPRKWPAVGAPLGFSEHQSDGESYRMLRAFSADQSVLVEVASSERSRNFIFDTLMLSPSSFFPLLYAFPILLLPVWLAVYSGLKPLRRLSKELAVRKPDDLSPIREAGVYKELTPFVAELNAAFGRISSLLSRERSFLADAAHELRTPLAVMAAQCDTLRTAATNEAREAALKRLDGGLLRASRLVNQLLTLARLEADVEDARAPVDLADVVRDCLAQYAGVAFKQGIDLSYTGPDSLPSNSPGHCVESIIDNLVGNAVRYIGPGSRIEVELNIPEKGQVALTVRDDGPGIPAAEVPRLFERFRRGRAVTATGSGLGLAIVKSAARQLEASINIATGLNGAGVEFQVAWATEEILSH